MSFGTVLSIIGADQDDGDLVVAADLCERAAIHLSVYVVALAAPPPIGRYAAALSDSWFEERQADMRRLAERVASVTRFLANRALSADVVGDYLEAASADEAIGRRARYCDLTVVGPGLLAGERLRSAAVAGALFSSGRPLLLAPATMPSTLAPSRVLVAWDGSVEAARAVREALDLLVQAKEVRLALVDPVEGSGSHGDEPGADMAAYLARHGVKVVVDRLPGGGRPVAEVLARCAVDSGAEMLVMGAYGHSRLRERVFGGVTRSMLDGPPLPIFMAR